MNTSLLHRIAITLIPNIGCVYAKLLLQHLDAEEVFSAKKSALLKIEGLGEARANAITRFNNFERAAKEMEFIEKYKITPLFITDDEYPKRLLNCYDSPTMLYYKGNADLNTPKIIAVVGSRSHTGYGATLVDELLQRLSDSDLLVISGLAYGIDSLAHKTSLKYGLSTVGVLAHGLDKIYPAENKALAKEMLTQGGLLTEFMANTKPDRHHFPGRNRIVAGISDAVIIVETDVKGGSMITAELANGYNKDVFAFPGKIHDKKSAGCNHLIKNNKAVLLTDAKQLIEALGWSEGKKTGKKKNRELFIELTPDERIVTNLLKEQASVSIDDINLRSGMSSSRVAVAILNLEMQQVIKSLPGKMYQLL